MGRSGRGGKRKMHVYRRGGKKQNVWHQDADAAAAAAAAARPGAPGDRRPSGDRSEAPAFEAYYRAQPGVVPPAEFDAFLACLRTPLPLTFRINGAGPFAAGLRAELEAGFAGAFGADGVGVVVDGEAVPPPLPLPWYPDRLAWQLATTRAVLRKHPPLAALHATLVAEHNGGRITRQEAVSMVPPLLLDVAPHHLVLDACASPGSKTAQLLEALAAGGEGVEVTGAVVANDKDPRRANMLAHTTARVASPGLIITCHDASGFPTPGGGGGLPRPSAADAAGKPPPPLPPHAPVLFDRVLADVPCSGDGTLRKAPDVWRKWGPAQGLGLHPLQLRIAARCAALLAPGGRMVYSTCSLNPVEDEAVVAALLACPAGRRLSLVDVSDRLPGLQRCAGLHTWLVPSKKGGGLHATAAEAAAASAGEPGGKPPPATAFAPDAATAAAMHLERCMRVLPHHGNTGGFFIAVLEKAAGGEGEGGEGEAEAEEEEEAADAADGAAEPAAEPAAPAEEEAAAPAAATTAAPSAPPPPPRRGDGAWGGADPLVDLGPASPLAASLAAHYGLPATDGPLSRLMARSVEGVAAPRRLFAVTAGVRRLLGADAARRRLKVATAGVKAFERQADRGAGKAGAEAAAAGGAADAGAPPPPPPPYRVTHEGLTLLGPLLTRQLVRPTVGEVLALLDARGAALPAGVQVGVTKKGGDEATERKEEQKGGGGGGGKDAPAGDAATEADAAAGDAATKADAAAAAAAPPLPAHPRPLWSDPATLADVGATRVGGCVVALRPGDAAALGLGARGLCVAAYRGRASVTCHVNATESAAYAARLRAALRAAGRGEEAGDGKGAAAVEAA